MLKAGGSTSRGITCVNTRYRNKRKAKPLMILLRRLLRLPAARVVFYRTRYRPPNLKADYLAD